MTSSLATRQTRPRRASRQEVARALCEANRESFDGSSEYELPSREVLSAVLWELRSALFPLQVGARRRSLHGLAEHVRRVLNAALAALEDQIRLGLLFEATRRNLLAHDYDARASELTERFAARLPQVRAWLGQDVRAALESEPAATSPDEAIFCLPGLTAIVNHRLAHELERLGVPLVPRVIAELSHASTGIDIHPRAQIEAGFVIHHGTGIVIGETSVIGPGVRLYQGVTLGSGGMPVDPSFGAFGHGRRHPLIEADVVIHAGAVLLGRIVLGRGSVIGGNVCLTESVPAGSRVVRPRIVRTHTDEGNGI